MRAIAITLLAASGCAVTPSIRTMQVSPDCWVWIAPDGAEWPNGLVSVEDERAFRLGGGLARRPVTYFTSREELAVDGPFGPHVVARFAGGALQLDGWPKPPPIPLGDGEAQLPGGWPPTKAHFNRRCSPRDAAAGVAALYQGIGSGFARRFAD